MSRPWKDTENLQNIIRQYRTVTLLFSLFCGIIRPTKIRGADDERNTGSLLFHAGDYEISWDQQRYRLAMDRYEKYARA